MNNFLDLSDPETLRFLGFGAIVGGISYLTGRLHEFSRPDGTNDSHMRIARLKRQLIVARSVHSGDSDGAPEFLSATVERRRTHQGVK